MIDIRIYNVKGGHTMGDKGKKDKEKGKKQKIYKQDKIEKKKLDKQPKNFLDGGYTAK